MGGLWDRGGANGMIPESMVQVFIGFFPFSFLEGAVVLCLSCLYYSFRRKYGILKVQGNA